MDKVIDDLNTKFSINFQDKGQGKYTYFLPPDNRITVDIIKNEVDSTHWYGGSNTNGFWNDQPREEQDLEGLVHNLITINSSNKDSWKPPY